MKTTGAATLGRPPKPKHLQRTSRLVVQLTPKEMDAFNAHFAASDAPDRSEFARGVLGKTLKPLTSDNKAAQTIRRDKGGK